MKLYTIILLGGLLLLAMSIPGQACTGIMLHNEDGSIVHGRTVEFAQEIDFSVLFVPRNYQFVGKTPSGDGLTYIAKYAALGVMTFTDANIVDGINEKGLAAGVFYFPTCAGYTPVTKENQSKGLSPTDFTNWILTQFATTEEVKKAVEAGTVIITSTVLKNWGPTAPPFHYVVYDKSGKSIVIEPIDGKLVVYDNPLGVMTNSPTFDWHMTNLRNYLALNPQDVPAIEVAGFNLQPIGQGNGMLGLPGDFTPVSRFVRATAFSVTAVPSKDITEGIAQTFHILNNFDIPLGVSREKEGGTDYYDHTLLTVVRDPQGLVFYYKSYADSTVRKVAMKELDLDSKDIKKFPVQGKQVIVDMTKEL